MAFNPPPRDGRLWTKRTCFNPHLDGRKRGGGIEEMVMETF